MTGTEREDIVYQRMVKERDVYFFIVHLIFLSCLVVTSFRGNFDFAKWKRHISQDLNFDLAKK